MRNYNEAVKKRTAWLKKKYGMDGRKARSMTIHDFKSQPSLLKHYQGK
jgi:hypothetical protein